ncbi:NIF3-like protein 1 [Ciona intestinalis]
MFSSVKLLTCVPTYLKSGFFRKITTAMELTEVVACLNKLAPLHNAEGWDNVGLLVEPSPPHIVSKIMLTNDLTEAVLQEGISANVNMIISYHPPIFKPLKRLTMSTWKERIVVKSLENRIAIYSPHTACDAVQGGVNDWLASGLGEMESIKPIIRSNIKADNYSVSIAIQSCNDNDILESFEQKLRHVVKFVRHTNVEYECQCDKSKMKDIVDVCHTYNLEARFKVIELAELPAPDTGMGRLCILNTPCTVAELIIRIKKLLSIPYVRLSLGSEKTLTSMVNTVALCAGSGASVFSGVKADVYLTGEMSHHEVLDAASNGVTTVLCEHSNTERGYLISLKKSLEDVLGSALVKIMVSVVDEDPLQIC